MRYPSVLGSDPARGPHGRLMLGRDRLFHLRPDEIALFDRAQELGGVDQVVAKIAGDRAAAPVSA